jgi:hypothetical protein
VSNDRIIPSDTLRVCTSDSTFSARPPNARGSFANGLTELYFVDTLVICLALEQDKLQNCKAEALGNRHSSQRFLQHRIRTESHVIILILCFSSDERCLWILFGWFFHWLLLTASIHRSVLSALYYRQPQGPTGSTWLACRQRMIKYVSFRLYNTSENP